VTTEPDLLAFASSGNQTKLESLDVEADIEGLVKIGLNAQCPRIPIAGGFQV
jgi:hypothetical protein